MVQSPDTEIPFDSGHQQIGKVYATALLGVCEKSGNTDAVLSEFDALLTDVLGKLPRFNAVLVSLRVPVDEKIRILDGTFRDKMLPQLLTFLKVVARHGRLDALAAMNRAAHEMDNERRGRVEVQLQTAVEVDGELLDAIKSRLQQSLGREVLLRQRVNEQLIGGLVVRVGDTVYDGSVARQLLQMREGTLTKAAHSIRESLARFASESSSDQGD